MVSNVERVVLLISTAKYTGTVHTGYKTEKLEKEMHHRMHNNDFDILLTSVH